MKQGEDCKLGEPYKLIIADDEFLIRDGLQSFDWKRLGFEMIQAVSNGKKVLELMAQKTANLIITDIKMPVMDGLELSKIVREKYPDCKIVILTGYRNFDYAKSAISAGVSEYLLKPVDLNELEELILRLKQKMDEEEFIRGIVTTATGNMHNVNENAKTSSYVAVQQAIKYIQEHYSEKITLRQLSDHVFLSPSYFSIQFKKETGKNFVEYLKEYRIEKAKELLRKSCLKVYEISEMVGYQNPKYFTDAFTGYTGLTPLEFRQKSS